MSTERQFKDPEFLVAERKEFESWAVNMGWRIDRTYPTGAYTDRRTNSGWLAWAALANRRRNP